jgi:hypothetical protein
LGRDLATAKIRPQIDSAEICRRRNILRRIAKLHHNWDEKMPSFATILRAAVMLAAAIIVVKGWQLYGPSAEQMKSWTARVAEQVHLALSERPQLAPVTSEPAGELKSTAAATVSLPDVVAPASRFEATEFAEVPPLTPEAANEHPPATNNLPPTSQAASAASERMPTLLARLERLGAIDPQLAAWGSGGKLYRFCCRAALADAPRYTRHFESVAAEPLVAVEQVVAKVEAWRVEQAASADLR